MKLKVKTKLAFLLCVIMSFSLCGCGGKESRGKEDETPVSTLEDQSNVSDTGDGESSDSSSEDSADDNGGAASDNVQYTDPLSPAPLGEWIKVATFNPVSNEQEVIYWRVVSVSEDAQASVDAYNNGDNFWILEQPEEDFIKYYEMEYEIQYPEEYSQDDFGITVSDLMLDAEKPDGRGFEKDGTTYLGVGECTDVTKDTIGESEENPRPGDTIRRRVVFTMMDGYTDYVFSYTYEDTDGERKTSYAASR